MPPSSQRPATNSSTPIVAAIAQMTPQLPKLFGLLPPTQLEVKAVEEFREKDASGAEYTPGTPDGSRRGTVMINTGDYQHRSLVQRRVHRLPRRRPWSSHADFDCPDSSRPPHLPSAIRL